MTKKSPAAPKGIEDAIDMYDENAGAYGAKWDRHRHAKEVLGYTSNGPNQQWSVVGNCYFEAYPTSPTIAPGVYKAVELSARGLSFAKLQLDTDQLFDLPGSPAHKIIEEIRKFWTKESLFADRQFTFKRGVMAYGPPGSGKTAMVYSLLDMVIKEHAGIGFLIEDPDHAAHLFQALRKIEPNRPVVAVMEDLDELVKKHGEGGFLALLNGEAQIDNIVFVATTNFPKKLDARFIDRPSRFDIVRYVGMPTPDARRIYLSKKEPALTKEELDHWVEQSEGFSIAHIRELIVLVKCLDYTVERAVKRLRKMRKRDVPLDANEDPKGTSFGFTAKDAEWGTEMDDDD